MDDIDYLQTQWKRYCESEGEKYAFYVIRDGKRYTLGQEIKLRELGTNPPGDHCLDGEKLVFTDGEIYGVGTWVVLQPDAIWYVENNGRDGDDWSHNNVRTGGAGAIGWKIAWSAELVDEIRTMAARCASGVLPRPASVRDDEAFWQGTGCVD